MQKTNKVYIRDLMHSEVVFELSNVFPCSKKFRREVFFRQSKLSILHRHHSFFACRAKFTINMFSELKRFYPSLLESFFTSF